MHQIVVARGVSATMTDVGQGPAGGPGDEFATPPRVGHDKPSPDAPGRRPVEIDAVIEKRSIRTVFQPIVHIASRTLAGFEALSRGPAGSSLESPGALLAAAGVGGRLGELDWVCRVSAMNAAADSGFHPDISWFINVEPAGLATECPPDLMAGLVRGRALRIVLEVVERDIRGNTTALLHAVDRARATSWGVAVDDVGADEHSLALLPFLRPDVVKLDMSLVQTVPAARAAHITAAVRAYAERTGAAVLAEGVETGEHEDLAGVFGATYGQGYRYGSPGPLPVVLPPHHVIPVHQNLAPLTGETPFEILARAMPTARAPKRSLLHISRHLEDQAGTDHSAVVLAGFQDRVFFSPAQQHRYRHLSDGTALTVVLADGLDPHDRPRYHVGPPRPGSRLGREWLVIVTKPHYAAAFVARDCGDTGPDRERRFDYVYTHNRDAVITAARSYLQELGDEPKDPSRNDPLV